MSDIFTDAEIAYMGGLPLARLATAQPGGTLQVSPVGARFNPATGTIDVGGHNMAASRKFRNVAANGQAAIVFDDLASVQPWVPRCLEIRGTAEAIEAPEDSGAGMAGPIIRIHPKRIISWGIDPAETSRGKRNV